MQVAKKLLVYTSGGGRTCDQLLTLAQFSAFVREHGDEFSVIDCPFEPFVDGFDGFRFAGPPRVGEMRGGATPLLLRAALNLVSAAQRFSNAGPHRVFSHIALRARRSLLRAIENAPGRLCRWPLLIGDGSSSPYAHLRGEIHPFVQLEDPAILAKIRTSPVTVLCGPRIRAWSLVRKHEDHVRRELAIRSDITARAKIFLAELRSRYDFLIGVMVRQGDYKTYRDGRFHFSSRRYRDWMNQSLSIFADRGRVGFVIASDEVQDTAMFSGLPFAFTTGIMGASGHYLESLAELAGCDLLMSPPSSFGTWGAFLSGASILPLVDQNQEIERERVFPDFYHCLAHPEMSLAIW